MRGVVGGRKVKVSTIFLTEVTTTIAVEVRLARCLLLGLSAQVSAPQRTPDGRMLGGLRTSVDAIDPARAGAMLGETTSGAKVTSCLHSLGTLGWVELRDTQVRAHCDGWANQVDGYVTLVNLVVETAKLAEAARSEIPPEDWEARLRARLEAVAIEQQLAFDERALAVSGRRRDSDVELRLEATDRYALLCRIAFPVALPQGSHVVRRTRFWSRVAAFLGIDRPTGDRRFNARFEATPPVRLRLTPEITELMVDMSRLGDLTLDARGVTFRAPADDVNVAEVLSRALALVGGFAVRPRSVPYRDAGR